MLKKINLPAVITFLLCLAVFSTWVSQSLLDLASGLIGILAIFTLFSFSTRGELFENKNLNRILPWVIGYFLVACLGYYNNGRPGADVVFSLTRFSWIILLYVLTWSVRYFDAEQKSFKWFFYLLLIPALYGYNIFFNNGNDILEGKFADGRIIGIVQSATYHSHIGGFFVAGIFTWLYLKFLRNYKNSIKSAIFNEDTVFWLIGIMVFLSVFFTRTRGALLSIAVSVCFLFWVKYRLKFIFRVFIPLFVIGLTAVLMTPIKDQLIRKQGDGCRVILAKVHIEMIKSHPLLGIGYRDNMRQIADYWPENLISADCEWARAAGSQAHNQILNVAATTGLLGLLCYGAVVIWFFILNFRWYRKEQSDLALLCLVLQVYFQMSCLTEITFEFAKIRLLILVVWAVVAYKAPTREAI